MNKTPFTTSPSYYTDIHGSPGRCVIKSPRGLVATMEAGYQTREEDAARIVATVEAFPRVLAALKSLFENTAMQPACYDSDGTGQRKYADAILAARIEIDRAEGRTS